MRETLESCSTHVDTHFSELIFMRHGKCIRHSCYARRHSLHVDLHVRAASCNNLICYLLPPFEHPAEIWADWLGCIEFKSLSLNDRRHFCEHTLFAKNSTNIVSKLLSHTQQKMYGEMMWAPVKSIHTGECVCSTIVSLDYRKWLACKAWNVYQVKMARKITSKCRYIPLTLHQIPLA